MVKSLIPWKKQSEALSPAKRELSSFDQLHQEMNNLFDRFFDGFGLPARWPSFHGLDQAVASITPRFEVSETKKEVRVKAELPGMEEKDVEVTIDDNLLSISGEKREEREENKRDYSFSELSYGTFHRSIPLPAEVHPDKAKAKFKKGVLTITVPKREDATTKRKTITIESE